MDTVLTGGCQCGAIRYSLSELPVSTICHCRMCQKAVGGPFAALSKLPVAALTWTRGTPNRFRSSSIAERHFCGRCGTPLTFHFLDDPAIEVTTGSLDTPAALPPTRYFGVEGRLPWISAHCAGALPETTTMDNNSTTKRGPVISRQHPDHDTAADWAPASVG
jgi:hypothetical protein